MSSLHTATLSCPKGRALFVQPRNTAPFALRSLVLSFDVISPDAELPSALGQGRLSVLGLRAEALRALRRPRPSLQVISSSSRLRRSSLVRVCGCEERRKLPFVVPPHGSLSRLCARIAPVVFVTAPRPRAPAPAFLLRGGRPLVAALGVVATLLFPERAISHGRGPPAPSF